MKFLETAVAGAWVIEPEPIEDERGSFLRLWCERELGDHGLSVTVRQTNAGYSYRAGTLRGLHYQRPPHAEVKLLRCTRGRVWDVVVDLRPHSPTFREWYGVELTADNRRVLYVPEGCATGYLTLSDGAEVHYQTSMEYVPEAATGVRWDDPAFGIQWPVAPRILSAQDRGWPDFLTVLAAEESPA